MIYCDTNINIGGENHTMCEASATVPYTETSTRKRVHLVDLKRGQRLYVHSLL